MNLDSLIGQMILILPTWSQDGIYLRANLIGVDPGGVWVDSQEITEYVLRSLGAQATPKSLAVFLPFAQLRFAIAARDVPSLDEKAFGL